MQRAKTRKARSPQHNDLSNSRYLIDAGYGTDAALRRTAALLRRPAATCLRVNTLRADPAAIAGLIIAEQVSVVQFVPPMLEAFLEEPAAARCDSLRYVMSAGEKLHRGQADRCRSVLPAAQLRERWLATLGSRPSAEVVAMCGSGVTAWAG